MKHILVIYAVISLIAFLSYGWDKYRARKRRWRIPEAFLLALGLLGGSVGALMGMNLFRHKTKHWYFWAVNLLGFVAQLALAWFVIKKGF